MTRMLIALTLATGLHILLISLSIDREEKPAQMRPPAGNLIVTMSYKKPAPAPMPQKPPKLRAPKKVQEKVQIKKKAIAKTAVPKERRVKSAPIFEPPKSPASNKTSVSKESKELPEAAIYAEKEQSFPETDSPQPLPSVTEGIIASEKTSNQVAPKEEILTQAEPRYDINPPPQYPKLARRRGWQGTVLLDVFISQEGSCQEIKVNTSSGYALLDKASVRTVQKWHFAPGRKNGRPIAMWVQVPIRFTLQ